MLYDLLFVYYCAVIYVSGKGEQKAHKAQGIQLNLDFKAFLIKFGFLNQFRLDTF